MTNRHPHHLKDKLNEAEGLKIFQSESREAKQTFSVGKLVGIELAVIGIILMIIYWAYA